MTAETRYLDKEAEIAMSRRRWPHRGIVVGLLLALSLSGLGAMSVSQWDGATDETLQNLKTQTNDTIAQTSEALTYVLFAWDALQREDIEGGMTNAHRALNVLEGPDGEHYDPSYGDSDDGVGDGVGALVHAERMRAIIDDMSQGTDYKIAAENVDLFLQWAVGNLAKALDGAEDDPESAAQHVRQAQAMLIAALGSREEVDQPTQGSARAILAWIDNLQ